MNTYNKTKVLNCVNHKLTKDQEYDLKQLGEVTNLIDIDKELFSKIANSPFELARIKELARNVYAILLQGSYTHIHLPIGSPAFMDVLSNELGKTSIYRVYSHTERASKDIVNADGSITKTSVFDYKGLIII